MSSRAPQHALAEEFSAAASWWKVAGVDCAFTEEAQHWLADHAETEAEGEKPVAEEPAEAAQPESGMGGDPANWPQDLAAFQAWWLREPSLDDGEPTRRVPPRGGHRPSLMVLVPEPEQGDGECLLSGPEGELLASFLKNAGVEPERTYVASALPSRQLMADWGKIAEDGMGAVLLHHIRLVEPERVLILGRAVVELVKDRVNASRELDLGERSVPVLSGLSLDNLIKHPKRRKALWERWLEWTGAGRQ